MKWSRLFVFACLVAMGLSPVMAQQSRVVLPIELTRNGSLVARPQLHLTPELEGRLSLNGQVASDRFTAPAWLKGLNEDVVVTPTVRGDEITLAFSITSGDRKLRPTLVISKEVRGSIEWTAADGQPLTLTISWAQ